MCKKWRKHKMMYDTFKTIEKYIEENEYFAGGVGYYFTVDMLDDTISLSDAIRKLLIEYRAMGEKDKTELSELGDAAIEVRKLCEEWHFEKEVTDKAVGCIEQNAKIYKCCEDYEFISYGNICSKFRIIETEKEKVLLEFYIVD